MKVWVVNVAPWMGGEETEAVFSSAEKARQYVVEHEDPESINWRYVIHDFVVDENA